MSRGRSWACCPVSEDTNEGVEAAATRRRDIGEGVRDEATQSAKGLIPPRVNGFSLNALCDHEEHPFVFPP